MHHAAGEGGVLIGIRGKARDPLRQLGDAERVFPESILIEAFDFRESAGDPRSQHHSTKSTEPQQHDGVLRSRNGTGHAEVC